MPRLTVELIRKRAEHNDGILPDLEEISLHQEELEAIQKLLKEFILIGLKNMVINILLVM